jgi:hypothetical protein
VQSALKCRGREYLRIYELGYTMPEHIERLRERGLGGERALALCEFSASKGGSASSGVSRCGACTSASSACWRSQASRWISSSEADGC